MERIIPAKRTMSRQIKRNLMRKVVKAVCKKEELSMGEVKRNFREMGEKPTLKNIYRAAVAI